MLRRMHAIHSLFQVFAGLVFAGLAARSVRADNLVTFNVSGTAQCTNYCASVISVSGSFTVDLTTGAVVSGSMSMSDSADLLSSPLTLPFDSQGPFASTLYVQFQRPNSTGNRSYVDLIFPFGSFPSSYNGGALCDLPLVSPCVGASGIEIGPTDASAALLAASSGGGVAASMSNALVSPQSPGNAVPLLYPLMPSATVPGGPAFTLAVTGTGFVSGAVVNWNGSARTTTFLSSSQLTAAITAADIANPGTAVITVTNPGPGGGTSDPEYFQVTNPTVGLAFQDSTISAGQLNAAPVVADFNGDGKPDIAIPSSSAINAVQILLGNGDGTFQVPVNVTAAPANTHVQGVAVGDFNGDGKIDLVVSYIDESGNTPQTGTSVILGNGDGTFQAPVTSAITPAKCPHR